MIKKLFEIDRVFSTKRLGVYVLGIRINEFVHVIFGIEKIKIELPNGNIIASKVTQTKLQNEGFIFCLGSEFTENDIPIDSVLYLVEESV